MFENSLGFIYSYYICSMWDVALWDNSSSPQREDIQFTLSVFFEGHTNLNLICASLPLITELHLLTQTKRDSPRTNYFSFLIGSPASPLVWTYGYSYSTIRCPLFVCGCVHAFACNCQGSASVCFYYESSSESSKWEPCLWREPVQLHQRDHRHKIVPEKNKTQKNKKAIKVREAVKETWREHAQS